MENLFEQYAAGVIGNLPINKITNSDIIKILSPIDGRCIPPKNQSGGGMRVRKMDLIDRPC